MASAYNGASLSLIGTLLSLGADTTITDQMGRLASAWARESHHDRTVTFLENIGVMPLLCSVHTIQRVGKRSLLRMLPMDLIRLVKDMLAVPPIDHRKRRHMLEQ